MTTTNQSPTKIAAAEASRAYQAEPTPERLEAMRTAQRAYDVERNEARREAERQEFLAHQAALITRAEKRLSVDTPEALSDEPVGLVSPERARYLMMAPAVSGGAIWVAYDYPGSDDWYLAIGGVAVDASASGVRLLDRRRVIATVRADLVPTAKTDALCESDDLSAVIEILDRLERQN